MTRPSSSPSGLRPLLLRRARTIPRLLALALVFLALSPALLALGLVVDLARFVAARRPFMSVRIIAFGVVYLGGEVYGLLALLGHTLAGGDLARRAYALQQWWTRLLFVTVRRLFRLGLVVDGDACAGPGAVYAIRHASIIDTLLPSVLVSQAHGVKLRFVAKRELLEDPCLDIAGHRLPNHFVARKGADTERDVAAIRALAAGCAPDEGLLIYPEGTRFTKAKLSALGARGAGFTRVLPPKPAGLFALLDGAPAADVIFIAHTGLEGFAHVADVWSGALVGRTVHVRMWRVPRAEIPQDPDARTRWLYAEWARVDAFRTSPP